MNAPVPLVDAVKYCVELGDDVNAVDNRGYTALHGAAYLGNNDMINYLVSKGAKIDVKSKAGDSVADMANGPTRFGQPHLETVALLEKLGSAELAQLPVRPMRGRVPGERLRSSAHEGRAGGKGQLDKFAISLGMKEALYRPDVPAGRVFPGGQQ